MRKKKDKNDQQSYTKHKSQPILQKHNDRLNDFANKEARVSAIDTKIKSLKRELDKLKKEQSFNHLNNEMSTDLTIKINKIENEIEEFKTKREYILSGKEEIDYFFHTYLG